MHLRVYVKCLEWQVTPARVDRYVCHNNEIICSGSGSGSGLVRRRSQIWLSSRRKGGALFSVS